MQTITLSTSLINSLLIESASFRAHVINAIATPAPSVSRFEFEIAVKNLVEQHMGEKIAAIKALRTFSQNHMESFHSFYGTLIGSSATCLGLSDSKRIVERYFVPYPF